jgi:hypothetical protein
MNATHYLGNFSKMRSVVLSFVWVGIGLTGMTGCGSGVDSQNGFQTLGQPSQQRDSGATAGTAQPNGNASTANPELSVTAITHLTTIESDVAGRATLPVYFNVELLVDAGNRFQLLNVHRQGTTRPALPSNGSATASDRARICDDNSKASQENCDVDLQQLAQTGVVVERFLGRAGVVLKAESGFSASEGGILDLNYIQQANLNDSSKDQMASYSIRLEHQNGQWLMLSGASPDKGPFTLMKLASNFSGLFATGVKTIQVGTSDQSLW